MATDFIDRLRSATFPTARRGGYDPGAVDAYLGELADWLETGGDDQTRTALVQRDMERVGERTGAILAAAQESADRITSEARADADKLRVEAEAEAAEARSAAEAYSTGTRNSADEHVRISAEAATRGAADLRVRADAEAQEKIGEADSRLRRATEEAAARTAGVEREIAELLRTRDGILANLEELAGGIRGVVDGPGDREIELPEGFGAATAPAGTAASESAGEHPVVVSEPTERFEPDFAGEDPPPPRPEPAPPAPEDEEPAAVDADTEGPYVEEEPTQMIDTEARERARERELKRRRDPKQASEPTTEDSDITDLL